MKILLISLALLVAYFFIWAFCRSAANINKQGGAK